VAALGDDSFDAGCTVVDQPLLGDCRIVRSWHQYESVRELTAEEVFEAGPTLEVRPPTKVGACDFE
jgi:hypothetical protein